MVKQFAFALGVTTCLVSIDLAHSKASDVLFLEALEGGRSSLRKSISLRTTNSKQECLPTSHIFARNTGNHGTLFEFCKNRGGLTSLPSFSFLHLNRLESSIASRPFFGNMLSAPQKTNPFWAPKRSSSFQRFFTAPSTLRGVISLPFLTPIKAPASRQFFFSNSTFAPKTTHAFLAQQGSTPLQRLFTASFLSHFRAPETLHRSFQDTVFAPRNRDLVVRPQTSFTAPFVKTIVEESTPSLKEAFSHIRTLTKPVTHSSVPITPPPSSTTSNEISFSSIIKHLVSTVSLARAQSVTSSLREETRKGEVAPIVSQSPSSLSHKESSPSQSPSQNEEQNPDGSV